MTKDEFLSSFNSLFSSDKPDALEIENLRTNILADYDALSTAQTAVQSFTTANENLAKENRTLQETNMKLIMLHPESINLNSSPFSSPDTNEPEQKELTVAEKDAALAEVLKGFGHKPKEE